MEKYSTARLALDAILVDRLGRRCIVLEIANMTSPEFLALRPSQVGAKSLASYILLD